MIKLILISLGVLWMALANNYNAPKYVIENDKNKHRKELVGIAKAEVGVKEFTGNNDGERVEEYLTVVKLKKGQPWCAAFVSWVFARAGYVQPRTGWSPSLFNKQVNTQEILPGNVFGIWFPQFKRVAHVGLVEKKEGSWILSIEGNTNVSGSRDGDGVYRKRRHVKAVYAYADWLRQNRGVL